MLGPEGDLRAGNERLAAEMAKGWLGRVAQAEPAGAA
jgi:hypothetical protein